MQKKSTFISNSHITKCKVQSRGFTSPTCIVSNSQVHPEISEAKTNIHHRRNIKPLYACFSTSSSQASQWWSFQRIDIWIDHKSSFIYVLFFLVINSQPICLVLFQTSSMLKLFHQPVARSLMLFCKNSFWTPKAKV